MRKLFLQIFLLLSILLSSCSSTHFYYSTIDTTTQNVEKVENGDFLFQNDSLWIAYCFKGESAPIQITIFNKLDEPLFVDWKKSSIIINGISHSYSRVRTSHANNAQPNYNYDKEFKLPQHTSFIPPQSTISHYTSSISARFDGIDKKKYSKIKLQGENKKSITVENINYDIQNSPLRFGSYLTLYTESKQKITHQTDFYMTNLIKTKKHPSQMPHNMTDRGDTFYQEKYTDRSAWQNVLASVGIITGIVILDVILHNDGD